MNIYSTGILSLHNSSRRCWRRYRLFSLFEVQASLHWMDGRTADPAWSAKPTPAS